MSSLRNYQNNSKLLLNTALTMFRSKQIRTIVVEGVCDKRFLSQWIPADTAIRFDGFNGKSLVNSAYINSRSKPYSDHNFLYFFADVDFDIISKQPLHDHPTFIYNAHCLEKNQLYFNDLETYLINTRAFEKVLINFDIDPSEAAGLRGRLELASRVTGSLRAADIIIQKNNNLRSSVLNGLEIQTYFNSKDITFKEAELHKALPRWSNYAEYTDDLIAEAKRINRDSPTAWSISRGHDLTEMLALHLDYCKFKGTTAEKLEMMLRVACELAEFKGSPMGKQLEASGGMTAMCLANKS